MPKRVHGRVIPRARPTPWAALWLALLLSLPAGAALTLLEAAWRWLY